MSKIPPAWIVLACLVAWFLQIVLTGLIFHNFWPLSSRGLQSWEFCVLGISLVLGALLFAQLSRALKWRPRRSRRPSAEVLAERQRIARDLHDSVGSQMLCAITLLNPASPQCSAAREALERCALDLRLIVDSMQGGADPLPDRLARLRYRLQPALTVRGIRMTWDVALSQDGTGLALVSQDKAEQVTLIVQEALTNVLQHARATEVRVSARLNPSEGNWQITVVDNGVGVPFDLEEGSIRPGRGLEGMKLRAQSVGARLAVTSSSGAGTSVQVTGPWW